ncbi:mitochondrial distribution and morphology family 33, partial [Dioszegia hungarica]
LGSRLNHVTGYEDIDRLKAAVVATGESTSTTELMIEQQLTSARDAAKALKHAYDQAVTTRASAQRSVNSLLERKDRWSDSDVADFTSLIRSDHASNAAVAQTSAQLNAAEADVDRLFSELTKTILTRYHEEQIWSDKIRSFSSWANLVGLAVNLVVFVGAIAFVEPWKRRKLAEGLEGRMAGMME